MAWIQDEYSKIYGYSPGVVTGKPIATGGSLGRASATGEGLAIVLETLLTHRGEGVEGLRVAIQGFGNVGRHTARALHERGARVVAVCDRDGGVHDPGGLDVADVVAARLRDGSLAGPTASSGASTIVPVDNASLLELDCDVLVPCAVSSVVTSANAPRLRCRYLLEGANSPVTAEADALLRRRGVEVVPDILANSGGVVVSYFEWAQNLQQVAWSLEEVQHRLRERLQRATLQVVEAAADEGLSLREAAYRIATARVKEAFFVAGF
jgi:glutamate dehydrogenase (NAD(P)+)